VNAVDIKTNGAASLTRDGDVLQSRELATALMMMCMVAPVRFQPVTLLLPAWWTLPVPPPAMLPPPTRHRLHGRPLS